MKTFTPQHRSEVDIRVAQELKNHNDFVFQTNQQLQNLSTSIVSLSLMHEKGQTRFFGQKQELQIAFDNLKDDVTNQLKEFSKRIGDVETRCQEILKNHEDSLDDFSKDYLTKESFVGAFYPAMQKMDNLSTEVNKKNSYMETEFSRVRSHINDQVEGVKKEIPSVEEFKPLKGEMNESFQSMAIDFKGLVKEIALLKKAVAYDQKKFENVYTLIERLKEGKQ